MIHARETVFQSVLNATMSLCPFPCLVETAVGDLNRPDVNMIFYRELHLLIHIMNMELICFRSYVMLFFSL